MKRILLTSALLATLLFGGDFENGVNAFEIGDNKKAISFFKKASNKGDAKAQYFLGFIYFEGLGVENNMKLAKEYLFKACKNGYADGCKMYSTFPQ